MTTDTQIGKQGCSKVTTATKIDKSGRGGVESDDSYEDWPTSGLKVTTVTKIDNAVGASVTTVTRIGKPRVQIDDNHEE